MKIKSLIARFILVLCTVTAVASCVKFDDSEIQGELSDIKSRLDALETKVNTNISSLWEIVNAQKNSITITSVSETDDSWIIVFSNGKTATVSKGGTASTPVIGVKQDTDGIYYWTLYGQWLLDGGGNKLPVSGTPGITPQLKIDGGYWYVSTDGGKTWTKLDKATGEDGDSFFKEVTWDEDYVYMTLQDGTKIVLRRGAGLVASIAAIPDYNDGSVKAGTSLFTIRFKVEPESAAEDLLYLDTDCFKLRAAYTLTKAAAGDLATLPIYEMEANDGILTILTDGEALADEFAKSKLGVSAALFICDGETLSVNSGYFPLYPKNEYLGHEYIDMGLDSGNKFADTNMGAENPWEPGNYYAWGELEPKKDYSWATYKWCDGTEDHMTKYNETDGLKSFADDNYKDDVARQEWGGEWRIPTKADWDELMDESKFTWTMTSKNGSKGYEIKSKKPGYEGESIFLPAAGNMLGTQLYGVGESAAYWSSTLYAKNPTGGAIAGGVDAVAVRYAGLAIRPVLGKYEHKSVKGVSLDRTSLTMVVGTKRQLFAKVEPESIKNPKLKWTSADDGVATVAKDGTVTAVSLGTTTITVKTVEGGYTATCTIKVVNQSDIVPEYVDLGLSVKWATFNLGATTPDDYGDYYAWGETETKEVFTPKEYKWYTPGNKKYLITKYSILNSEYDAEPVDNKTVLDPEDDAAHVNWGGSWRMPTYAEWKELIDNCTGKRTKNYNGTGVMGMIVTSNIPGYTEKSIFLPAAGYAISNSGIKYSGEEGIYWTSTLDIITPYAGVFCWFGYYLPASSRFFGHSIRPVYGEFVPVSSISLDKPSLELETGETAQLTVSFNPSNATAKNVHWTTSNESVAKVDKDGLVTAVKPGTATITAYGSSGVSTSCTVTVTPKTANPEYVDLGLSVKWATFNVGATKPEEAGDFFAWGETETKGVYNWSTYKFWVGGDPDSVGDVTLNKYVTSPNAKLSIYWGGAGSWDYKTVLDPEDDVAHVKWGGNWRMPTEAEWTELKEKCTWIKTNQNGVSGVIFTGPNGNSIFLPVTGRWSGADHNYVASSGLYWTSSLDEATRAFYGYMDFDYFDDFVVKVSDASRFLGYAVRPVYGDFIPVSSISLDKKTLELTVDDTYQLTATVSPSNATAKNVSWASDRVGVALPNYQGIITARNPGTATITVYASSGVSASCTVTVKEGPKAVDLGLPSGIKWASCNVGATKPEEFGDYFSWGETETKNEYTWSSYKWGNGDWDADDHLSKYNTDPSRGNVDGNTMLLPEDDVAQDKWKGSWRMPTDDNWTELRESCIWTWTDSYEGTGVAGYIVEGTKNSSIFLPTTGHMEDEFLLDPGVNCGYWSSNLDPDTPAYAWFVYFENGGVYRTRGPRKYGYSVRPVTE